MNQPDQAQRLALIADSHIRSAVADYLDDTDANGIIRSPGKFQAEPLWAVYFYQCMLDGDGVDHYAPVEDTDEDSDEDTEPELMYRSFSINEDDAAIFPDLADSIGKFVRLSEDSSGFIYVGIADTASDDES